MEWPGKGKRHITWFEGTVRRADREKLHGHSGAVVWFTGYSASGKSTIAHTLEKMLHEKGLSTYVFDGDNVRHGLCGDLGFSARDRHENIRRISEMAALFLDAGMVAILAFISPCAEDRAMARDLCSGGPFFEVYVKCPPDVCATRDQKGIWDKARKGVIPHFTGVSAPYEPPENPDLVILSDKESPETAARRVARLLHDAKIY